MQPATTTKKSMSVYDDNDMTSPFLLSQAISQLNLL